MYLQLRSPLLLAWAAFAAGGVVVTCTDVSNAANITWIVAGALLLLTYIFVWPLPEEIASDM